MGNACKENISNTPKKEVEGKLLAALGSKIREINDHPIGEIQEFKGERPTGQGQIVFQKITDGNMCALSITEYDERDIKLAQVAVNATLNDEGYVVRGTMIYDASDIVQGQKTWENRRENDWGALVGLNRLKRDTFVSFERRLDK